MTYFIAHNGDDIIHYGSYEEGQTFDSGQPIIETFTDKQEWIERLKELNVDYSEELL
jgi:hypothetical protein